jgi:hypothetical protein
VRYTGKAREMRAAGGGQRAEGLAHVRVYISLLIGEMMEYQEGFAEAADNRGAIYRVYQGGLRGAIAYQNSRTVKLISIKF